MHPKISKPANNLGFYSATREERLKPSAILRKRLPAAPTPPKRTTAWGRLLNAGGLDDAIVQFRDALNLRPDYPEAHNGLGVAGSIKGRSMKH